MHVVVETARRGDRLRIDVEDDGPGPGASRHRGSGTGLQSLRERLELVYGDHASLEAGAGPDGGYLAVLRLPIKEPAS